MDVLADVEGGHNDTLGDGAIEEDDPCARCASATTPVPHAGGHHYYYDDDVDEALLITFWVVFALIFVLFIFCLFLPPVYVYHERGYRARPVYAGASQRGRGGVVRRGGALKSV